MSKKDKNQWIEFIAEIDSSWIDFANQHASLFEFLGQTKYPFFFLRLESEISAFHLRCEVKNAPHFHEKILLLEGIEEDDFIMSNYVFDSRRFGGKKASKYVLKYLNRSSKLTSQLMGLIGNDLNYEILLACALKFCSLLNDESVLDSKHSEQLLKMYFERWRAFMPDEIDLETLNDQYPDEIFALRQEEIEEENDADPLVKIILDNYKAFAECVSALLELDNKEKILLRDPRFAYPKLHACSKWQNLLEIIGDLIHFNFNIMGLQNEDEALVTGLVYLAKKEPDELV